MEQSLDLFAPVSRDNRQKESVDKWIKTKGHGTIVAGTGVGSKNAGTASIVP